MVFAQSGNNPKITVMKRNIFLFVSLFLLGAAFVQSQGGGAATKTKSGRAAKKAKHTAAVTVVDSQAPSTSAGTPAAKAPEGDAAAHTATVAPINPADPAPAPALQVAGGRELPAVTLQDLDMKKVSSADFANDGKPIIISFWATWCKPCIQELIAIQENYEELVEETGAKLIAISIDDARNAAKVRPFTEGRAWEYEIYLDVNQDFKRALNVNNVPHTFVVDGNRMIVWDHNSYSPGDEEHLFEVVRNVAAGKPAEEKH
jgi:cytochrome c biogenesis protein CcmG, thiol:disulfide interchange protein DsbE